MSENSIANATFLKGLGSRKLSIFIAILLLVADQISKFCVVKHFACSAYQVQKITSFFNLVYVQNDGISLGFFPQKESQFLLIIPVLFVTAAFILFIRKTLASPKTKCHRLPCYMIISGAIGNIIDRIHYGSVVDFADFYLSGYHWPAFNIADLSVIVGAGIFMTLLILKEKYGKKEIN